MKRTFIFELRQKIPALAWLMHVGNGDEEVLVKHGSGVECREDFFVSGVWAGEFSKGEIDETPYSCSTGGRLRPWGRLSENIM